MKGILTLLERTARVLSGQTKPETEWPSRIHPKRPNGVEEMISKDQILRILEDCWSHESSSKYDSNNPSQGQCSVSSIVIQKKFGGRILKTKINDCWHFYNELEGEGIDFTKEQFSTPIDYQDIESSTEEALCDCIREQVEYLLREFNNRL